jgi:protein-disulfide isomerase
MHRFARPAARALECAGDQLRFGEFVEAVYLQQDSLGLKPWTSIARDAGVTDTARFERCVSEKERVARIEDGVAAATRLNVTATPTVIVNGWKFALPPSEQTLMLTAERLLRGQSPADRSR